MSIKEWRKQNLRDKNVSPAVLASKLGGRASYYSDLMNDPNKSFGEKAAQRIEEGMGWPRGDLNREPEGSTAEQRSIRRGATTTKEPDKYINFDLLDVQAGAGPGRNAVALPEVVRRINVLESWARSALGGDLARIRLITARGTSMQGTIENGDVLFVDETVKSYDGDGIYIIARSDGVQAKRLQKTQDGIAIISDNRANKTEWLRGEDANALTVCGRVLAAWSLRRLW